MPPELNDNKQDNREFSKPHKNSLVDTSEIKKISELLNPEEEILLVTKQSRIKPVGSYITPDTVYATDRRIIIRDPYMLGIKANVVDIPYDIITSLKIENGILSSTIRFKAPGLMSSTKLGMMYSMIEGEDLDAIKFYDLIALTFKDKNDIISSFVIVEYSYDPKKEIIKYLDIKYSDKRLEKHVEENPNVIKNIDSYIKNKLLKSEFGFN